LCPFLAAVVIKVRKKGSSNFFFFLKKTPIFSFPHLQYWF
jgi:hypothetical protein